jgi:hypothetical protein
MTIEKVLDRSDRSRAIVKTRLDKTPETLAGVDDLLGYIGGALRSIAADTELQDLDLFARRGMESVEIAIVATFGGMVSVALDACRDLMELEMLLRDFAAVPGAIRQWHSASENERWRKFRPAVLRERHARRTGVDVKDLQDSKDYRNHSASLHTSPVGMLWRRGVLEDPLPWLESDFAVVELIDHGVRFVRELYAAAESLRRGSLQPPETAKALLFAEEIVHARFVPEYKKIVDGLIPSEA